MRQVGKGRFGAWMVGLAVGGCLVLSACGATAKTEAQVATDELNAGLAAQRQGKNDEAAQHYHNVLAHDPRNQYAYYDLGLIDQNASRGPQAEQEYRQALQIDPNMTGALFNLAIIVTPTDPAQAVQLYQKVIQLQPRNAAAHLNLGFVYRDQGKADQAKAEFATATALDPALKSRIPAPSPSP
jgi:Tfp pilus assembly protein PilF